VHDLILPTGAYSGREQSTAFGKLVENLTQKTPRETDASKRIFEKPAVKM
jgi:hypothetical protein